MKPYWSVFYILFVISCGQTPRTDEIIFANSEELRDFNPHFYQGAMWAQEMVFETLVSVEDDGIKPELAEYWDISEDGRTYTFHIRGGMEFSDGEVLDAYAIEKNFDALWANKDRHIWLGSMAFITSYKAINWHTFELKLSQPFYPVLIELGVSRPFAMVSPKAMKDGGTKDGLLSYTGSGPYVFVEKTGSHAIFEANTNYWGKQPAIKKVTMRVIPDNFTRLAALEKGEIDLIYGANQISSETLSYYKNNTKFTANASVPTMTRHLALNTKNPILNDINVRRALSHAVNRKDISEGIFYGMETPAETLFAKNVSYSDIELVPFEYSLEKASQILEESGWILAEDGIRVKEGQRLSFRLLYDSHNVFGKVISELLQAEFKSIGVETKLEGFEYQTYADDLKKGNFDIAHNIAWGTPYDPQSTLSSMRVPAHGDYAAQLGLSNKAEIDELIGQVLASLDEVERQKLYTKLLTMLHESATYIPITYENNKSLHTSKLKGVVFKPSQYRIPFEKMYFE